MMMNGDDEILWFEQENVKASYGDANQVDVKSLCRSMLSGLALSLFSDYSRTS